LVLVLLAPVEQQVADLVEQLQARQSLAALEVMEAQPLLVRTSPRTAALVVAAALSTWEQTQAARRQAALAALQPT